MADPRQSPANARKNPLSPLMKAKAENGSGEKLNFCPFDADTAHVDDNGYCDHLVGFTNDGKGFEPMVRTPEGKRIVQVPLDEHGKPILSEVLKSDKLIQITVSSRVYRDVSVKQLAKK